MRGVSPSNVGPYSVADGRGIAAQPPIPFRCQGVNRDEAFGMEGFYEPLEIVSIGVARGVNDLKFDSTISAPFAKVWGSPLKIPWPHGAVAFTRRPLRTFAGVLCEWWMVGCPITTQN